jgi:CubicO group peptidase (beta-lactamase class C family)
MRSMRVVTATFLLAVVGVGVTAARAEGPRRPPDAPLRTELRGAVTVPLGELGYLVTVRALVNGRGPYRLAIDTGSADVLRVSARLAKALALPRIGVVRTGDPSGRNAIDVPIVRVASVAIGGARFDGIEASVGTRLGSPEPDGIIGLGLFARVTAQLDYPKRLLRLSHRGLPRQGAHVVALRRRHGVPQVAIGAAGKTLWADVDTGSRALLTVPARVHVPLADVPRVVRRGRTAANEFEIRAARLAGELRVAGWSWRRPTVDIVDLFPTASIGAALLRRYAVTFDLPHGRLELARVDGPAPGWRALDAYLRRRAAGGQFSGAVLVAKNGRPLLARGYGLADRTRRIANTAETRFCIASLGKMFTAVAIAQLVEQGRLSFSDAIGKYVRGFPPAVADTVTIAELLTHTSGLGDVALGTPDPPRTLAAMLQRIARKPLRFKPGSRFSYSNDGFIVLGAIVERVSGQSYADYVRKHIFEPAGMTATAIRTYRPVDVPRMAHGYMRVGSDGQPVQPGPGAPRGALRDNSDHVQIGNPSGGSYSTVTDLLAFAEALTTNKLLGSTLTKTVLAGKVDARRPGGPHVDRYAYGFDDARVNGVRIVGHNGGTPGYEGQLDIYPDKGYVAVMLTNQDGALTPAIQFSEATFTR